MNRTGLKFSPSPTRALSLSSFPKNIIMSALYLSGGAIALALLAYLLYALLKPEAF